jgi:hypothetical protein
MFLVSDSVTGSVALVALVALVARQVHLALPADWVN